MRLVGTERSDVLTVILFRHDQSQIVHEFQDASCEQRDKCNKWIATSSMTGIAPPRGADTRCNTEDGLGVAPATWVVRPEVDV